MVRLKYAEYIGEAIRYAAKEAGLRLPLDTVLIVAGWSDLAQYNDLLGLKIIICNVPGTFEFFLGFPQFEQDAKINKLSRYFLEYLELYPMQ